MPAIVGLLAVSPAAAIAVSAQRPPELASAWHELELLRGPARDAWGLRISRDGIAQSPASSAGSQSAQRPSLENSPISADAIQAAVLAQGPALRECYLRSAAFQSNAKGTLVASMLIRRDGEVVPAVGGDDELRRAGVAACARDVLDRLSFPPQSDYGWVHLPLWFEP
jgi:hypothetical protein